MSIERGGQRETDRGQIEQFNEAIHNNPVILISANLPGSGSSTFAEALKGHITEQTGVAPNVTFFGQELRKQLAVTNEHELAEKLLEIPDPTVYDEPIYAGLSPDMPNIIEGKYATVAGPLYIKDRPVISVELSSDPLVSAKRVLQREGIDLIELFSDTPPENFLQRLSLLTDRADFEASQRSRLQASSSASPSSNHLQFHFNTSKCLPEEVIGYLNGECDSFGKMPPHVPHWELEALEKTQATLASLGARLHRDIHPNDLRHFKYQLESIEYGIDRLSITLDEEGINKLREGIKHSLADAWYGLMMKKVPRFFRNTENDEVEFDTESQGWSPEYYKVAEAWPILSTALKDKVILDPFAGAGTLMNLLVARGIPESAVYSDIAYPGGPTLQDSSHNYLPTYNTVASQLLFDNLPSWYRPDFSIVQGHITADATKLPLRDDAVDIVFSDPPYGKNLNDGSLEFLLACLPELMRVSKEGAVMMIPMKWLDELSVSGVPFVQLTKDVSHGVSHFPICYIKVEKEK